ncbi:hypothetical protein CONPUDRAFT_166858 [Coniophora puteana RWD-64-598 SS2]|uniref:NACHT domain-containing protein n=1 Tax=Coniophora puteana (strain RWD-64-598) TaxID=741705 RepID=A0A5M3MIT1_CONPW|nr:uncharacterized protein CONPUDRAFT_166858 [Coniophora puteana RWD-64-598 SS2]EIW79023.1 hypothetical protein CONPUDRAFT_166858 [Coniophora puteana RWD-64-598 SS2]
MPDTDLQYKTYDDVWRGLANAIARGAEHDSNERRPFGECLPGTRMELLDMLEKILTQEEGEEGHQEQSAEEEEYRMDVDKQGDEEKSGRIYWLFGGSGTGKSSVACSIAERLRRKEHLAATFFFSRKDVTRSRTDLVFLTLSYQIGLRHPRAKLAIVKAIKDDPALLSAEKSRRAQFDQLVAAPLRELNMTWRDEKRSMIFDAIDEGAGDDDDYINADHMKHAVSMLAELLRNGRAPISSVLFTSRPYPYLRTIIQDIKGITPVEIEDFNASRDVEVFLRDSFQKISDVRRIGSRPSWPSDNNLNTLLSQVKGHFIVAATISRLVGRAPNPKSALNHVSAMYSGRVDLSRGIDSVYHHILSDCEPEQRRAGAECLGTIIALAEPLSPSTLCQLYDDNVLKHIEHLFAIVFVPHLESSNSIQIYHASLQDYILDQSRSGEFYVDPADSRARLVCSCLELMENELKEDICGLEDSSRLHSEFDDFEYRKEVSISSALCYACLFWTHHLERANHSKEVQEGVFYFVQNQLLFFIEVSSIIGNLQVGVRSLTGAEKVVSKWDPSPEQHRTLRLLYDTWRLVLQFFEPIRTSALHLYESALAFCPRNTQLYASYRDLISKSKVLVESELNSWDYILRTFDSYGILSITLSPDGRKLATVAENGGLNLWDTVTGTLIAVGMSA